MPLYPVFYLGVTGVGWFSGIALAALYALLTYVFIYFNIPSVQWWGGYVPDLRWSYTSALVVAAGLFIHRRQITRNPLKDSPAYRLLILYLLWMLITVPLSVNTDLAFSKVYDFFRYVVVFGFILAIIDTTGKLRAYIWIILTQIAYLSWTARSYFHGARLDGVGPGDAGDANSLAILLISFLPFFLVFLLQGKKWEKITALVCLPITLNCLAMTRSRGGFLGFATGMIVLFLLERVPQVRKRLVILSMITAVALFSLSDQAFKDRLMSTFNEDTSTASAGRVDNWRYGLQMSRDHLLGAGGGSYMYLSPFYLPANLLEHHAGTRAAHNTYLLVLVEQGIVGLVIFFLFLLRLAKTAFLSKQQILLVIEQKGQQQDHAMLYMFNNATLAGMASLMVAGFFCDSLYFEGLYFLTAIFPAVYHTSKRELDR